MTLKKEDIYEFTEKYSKVCLENDSVDKELFTKYGVKRGLRDLNGKGVLTGITNISRIESSKIVDGKSVPCPGSLYYRGYNIKDLVKKEDMVLKKQLICYCLVIYQMKTS